MTLLTVVLTLSTSAASAPAPAPAAEGFDARLKSATGPLSLHELLLWCRKGKHKAEEERVKEVMQNLTAPVRAPADAASRERQRRLAVQAREEVKKFLALRVDSLSEKLVDIVEWMKAQKYATPGAKERILGIASRVLEGQSGKLRDLENRLRALKHEERHKVTQRSLDRQFDSRFSSIRREFTNKIFSAVEKCLKAGEAGYAYDVYRWLLTIDPDNDRAHRGLGETKVGDHWLRPFGVQQYKAGLIWDQKWGWIPRDEKMRARYDKGEAYDHATKKWGRLSDLNKLHSDGKNPWRIESEHFLLVSTADLQQNVKLIKRLEDFFLQTFRQFDRFFGGKRGTQLIFGMARSTKRLKVNFYRNRDQFRQFAKPPTSWAAGFYSGGRGGSFFYQMGRSTFRIMQHELTHQILGEFSPGWAPSWIAEGAATYLENAQMKDGALALGGIRGNRRASDYRRRLRKGENEHSLEGMLKKFGRGGNWDSGNISSNYRGAAATWYFLMTFDNGRYRQDTVELLRDAYSGKLRDIHEYYGVSREGMSYLMKRFYKECTVN